MSRSNDKIYSDFTISPKMPESSANINVLTSTTALLLDHSQLSLSMQAAFRDVAGGAGTNSVPGVGCKSSAMSILSKMFRQKQKKFVEIVTMADFKPFPSSAGQLWPKRSSFSTKVSQALLGGCQVASHFLAKSDHKKLLF